MQGNKSVQSWNWSEIDKQIFEMEANIAYSKYVRNRIHAFTHHAVGYDIAQ